MVSADLVVALCKAMTLAAVYDVPFATDTHESLGRAAGFDVDAPLPLKLKSFPRVITARPVSPANMLSIFVGFSVLKLVRSSEDSPVQPLNMEAMSVTDVVLKLVTLIEERPEQL